MTFADFVATRGEYGLLQNRMDAVEEYEECHTDFDEIKAAWDAGIKATLVALDETAVVNWSYRKEHEDNPKLMLHDVICQEVTIALDPKVSSAARKLIDDAIKTERERAWAWIEAQGTVETNGGTHTHTYYVVPSDKQDFMDGK